MADYGLQVVNDGGFVQIDSTYKNLGLLAKGSVISSGTPTQTGWYPAVFSVAVGATPIVAARPSSGYAVLVSTVLSGNTVTYTYYCDASGTTLYYWVFDDPARGINDGSNYGLLVRNAASEVVFDSRLRYMRVLGFFSGNEYYAPAPPIDSGETFSYASSNLAVVQSAFRHWWTGIALGSPPNSGYALLFMTGFSISGSNATFKLCNVNTIYSNQGPITVEGNRIENYAYMVLDVSNF